MKKFRYFDRFKSQSHFHSTDLPSEFFYENYEKYKDIWHVYASSCTRHLISHKDCPFDLRDLYIRHSQLEKREAALLTNAPLEYMESRFDFIAQDRSRKLRERYTEMVLIPKLLGRQDESPVPLFAQIQYAMANDNPPFVDILDKKRKDIYGQGPTLDPDKFQPLHPEEYRVAISSASSRHTRTLIRELNDFAKNKSTGLLSEDKNIRKFAENYFRLRSIK